MQNAMYVDKDDRYKFIDDMTILEEIELLSIGITSSNPKISLPSHISVHTGLHILKDFGHVLLKILIEIIFVLNRIFNEYIYPKRGYPLFDYLKWKFIEKYISKK